MSLLDLIFGSGKKIYASQVRKIPAGVFNREVKLTVGGKIDVYKESKLRDVLERMSQNGITITKMEENLKNMGLKDSQYEKRKYLMDLIKEECGFNKKEEASSPKNEIKEFGEMEEDLKEEGRE
jgi:hypothetical protein